MLRKSCQGSGLWRLTAYKTSSRHKLCCCRRTPQNPDMSARTVGVGLCTILKVIPNKISSTLRAVPSFCRVILTQETSQLSHRNTKIRLMYVIKTNPMLVVYSDSFQRWSSLHVYWTVPHMVSLQSVRGRPGSNHNIHHQVDELLKQAVCYWLETCV